MKAIIFTHRDGSRWFSALVPADFDTVAWLRSAEQVAKFAIAGIVDVEELLPVRRRRETAP